MDDVNPNDSSHDMAWAPLDAWPGVELGERLAGGTVNDVRAAQRDGDRLVVRRTQRSDEDLQWEIKLLQHLSANGLSVPDLVATTDGRWHSAGIVVMRYVEGAEPATDSERRLLAGYLEALHELTGDEPEQRPGWCALADLCEADRSGPADLSVLPAEVADRCRRAWAPLADLPTAVIHGDPNPTNVRISDGVVTLLDWDEARRDNPLLDLAARGPLTSLSADDRHLAELAIHAWEACLFWVTDPEYARRRFDQLDDR